MSVQSTRLADFMPYRLSITTNAISDLIAGEYRAAYGLKIPEWRVMAVLGDAGSQTQRDLTGATLMDKVAVNRACKALETRQLIARNPNSQDGRSHHLELTATGRSMHGQIIPHALEMERKLMQVLEPEERAQLRNLIDRLADQARDLATGKSA